MRWRLMLLALLLAATGFFAATAIVRDEGGFEYRLVIKPEPGLRLFVGGGEEGAWRRRHPDRPPPWWLSGGEQTVLLSDSAEGQDYLGRAYSAALLLTLFGWLVLGLSAVWLLRRRSAPGRIPWPAPATFHNEG